MTDLIRHLKAVADKIGDQFELQMLTSEDELKVRTTHTEYTFKIVFGRIADLSCSRPDRPHGRAQIMGCTFGQSSSIKPDHLFCGGNLEFTYELDGQSMTHRTTAIRTIELRRRRPDAKADA